MTEALPSLRSGLAALLGLVRKAREACSTAELGFLAVNDTRDLVSYRQSALWFAGRGVDKLSGLVQPDLNVPYTQWLEQVCRTLATGGGLRQVEARDLPASLAASWDDWLPAYAVWVPFADAAATGSGERPQGALLFARDLPWTAHELGLLGEWAAAWRHAWRSLDAARGWRPWPVFGRPHARSEAPASRPWWRSRAALFLALVLAVAACPVPLTVLAPGELVPARPAVVRAPLEGVIDAFHVQPNERVTKGQPLFSFDEVLLRSRREVAAQALATAETEYRQAEQQALGDARFKGQLALIMGRIEEKRAEVALVEEQLTRARVLAPHDGIALLDDPSEWIGQPVTVGVRIMRIASLDDAEIEAWVPLADAIPLASDARISLYLNASPLAPVDGRLRYLAHDAQQRPDGNYAYRLRAKLDAPTTHRVGLKGTAKLRGRRVPLIYWVLRRPLASLRAALFW